MKTSTVILALWTLLLLSLLFLPLQLSFIPVVRGFSHFDKVAHFGLFAVTGFVNIFGAGFLSRLRSRLLFGLIFGVLLAIGTELAQYFIPNRGMEFYDLLADWAGLFLGLFCYTFFKVWKQNL